MPAIVAAVLVASCVREAEPPPAPTSPGPDVALEGTVLVASSFLTGLATVDLPDGEPRELVLPPDRRIVHAASLREDGSIVAVVELGHDVRVFRLHPEASPEQLGPPLRIADSFSFAGDRILAARCDGSSGARVLDLDAPRGWRPANGGCGATLSPDGSEVAWSPDGRVVYRSGVDPRAEPESVLDVSTSTVLPPGMGRDTSIIGALSWGSGGLAVAVGTTERQAAAVLQPDGTVSVASLGNRGAGIGASLAWMPSGDALAVASWSELEALVRLITPGGRSRVVAVDADPVAGLAWAPDGEALLVASQVRWTFVTPEGEWIRSTPVGRGDLVPLAWRSG